MNDLTDKQKECLIIINLLIEKRGYAPTVREIGKEMNVNSPATVFTHLKKLKQKGYITWKEKQNRTLKILKKN